MLQIPLSVEPFLQEGPLWAVSLDVNAAALDRFAGYTWLAPGALDAADPSPALLVLEGSAEQIVFWLYRDGVTGELIGQLVAP